MGNNKRSRGQGRTSAQYETTPRRNKDTVRNAILNRKSAPQGIAYPPSSAN